MTHTVGYILPTSRTIRRQPHNVVVVDHAFVPCVLEGLCDPIHAQVPLVGHHLFVAFPGRNSPSHVSEVHVEELALRAESARLGNVVSPNLPRA